MKVERRLLALLQLLPSPTTTTTTTTTAATATATAAKKKKKKEDTGPQSMAAQWAATERETLAESQNNNNDHNEDHHNKLIRARRVRMDKRRSSAFIKRLVERFEPLGPTQPKRRSNRFLFFFLSHFVFFLSFKDWGPSFLFIFFISLHFNLIDLPSDWKLGADVLPRHSTTRSPVVGGVASVRLKTRSGDWFTEFWITSPSKKRVVLDLNFTWFRSKKRTTRFPSVTNGMRGWSGSLLAGQSAAHSRWLGSYRVKLSWFVHRIPEAGGLWGGVQLSIKSN